MMLSFSQKNFWKSNLLSFEKYRKVKLTSNSSFFEAEQSLHFMIHSLIQFGKISEEMEKILFKQVNH